ncbi:hypothetical protein FH972_024180 [Carpinus fangiana]|uniref:Uncharacterized protein n=1 Tax=Carpinus fangiana TaxID=176857 RepID=A0A5N6KXZ6_9ROSI|nr:hypothetical protein FH972_024180 [Carpinus fangiana]
MRPSAVLSVALWGLSALADAMALSPRAPASKLVPPSEDPFYVPPGGLASQKPGAILKTRPAPDALASINAALPLDVDGVYQIMYRTTDSVGRPAAAVTTLIVPFNANTSRLLSYQTAYDQADNNCAPSYTLQVGANMTSAEIVVIAAALNQGWYVNTPDYEGLNASFTAGVISGQATLDSVRAALQTTSLSGLSSSAQYAMWGYSGGSIASEWAAELQQSYAPDLDFIGVAIGGLTPNISSVLLTISGTFAAGLAPRGIVGLSTAYSNLSTYLNQHLIPSKAATFYSVRNCSSAHDFSNEDIFSYFDNGEGILHDAVPLSVINAAGIEGVHGVPRMPLYVYKAVHDEISPIADTDALVSKLCGLGSHIEYVRDTVGAHGTFGVTGAGGALAFLVERFAGLPAATACSTTDVALTGIDPATVALTGSIIAAALRQLLGLPAGQLFPFLPVAGN